MGRRNLLFICAMCVSFGLAGQKRNNVWAFGDGAGLNFNSAPVTPFYSAIHPIAPPYYVSSICTNSGQLLFYTDGKNIFNTYNRVLPKYNNWWPWSGYVIPLVVPYINNDSLYYIFGVDYDPLNGATVSKLQYITTKMYKPGDIEESVYPAPVNSYSYYTTLLTDCSQVLAGTGHCNQQDRWITAHSPGALYSFLITSAGVNPVPVITKVPASVLPNKNLNVNYSNLKFSANGERLIIPVNDRNQIVVYDFDNQSGKFSNPIVLSIPLGLTLEDIEISADGSKLYFGAFEVFDPEVSGELHYLYQMNLNAGSVTDIESSLYKVNAGDRVVCFRSCYLLKRTMQLGPDGKIYVSRREGITTQHDQTLGVIEDPSKTGRNVNYRGTAIDLKVKPRFLNYNYIKSASFTPKDNSIQYKKNSCVDQPVQFSPIYNRLDSIKWNFGDPASGTDNFSTRKTPSHKYPGAGTYAVQAIIYNRCFQDTATIQVIINPDVSVTLPTFRDTTLCEGETIEVNATVSPAQHYIWNDGVKTPQRQINKPLTFELTATNECSSDFTSFTVDYKVCPCNSFIPNAFSPNYDGLNDQFAPVIDCNANNYKFQVYDHYGSIVFSTTKVNTGWDGMNKGTPFPQGVYVWYLIYSVPGTKETVRKKGVVTLLR